MSESSYVPAWSAITNGILPEAIRQSEWVSARSSQLSNDSLPKLRKTRQLAWLVLTVPVDPQLRASMNAY